MSTMSADEVRKLSVDMSARTVGVLVQVLGAVGLVNDAVTAEILATDAAAAQAAAADAASDPMSLLLTVEQAAQRLAVAVDDVRWMYLQDGLHYIRFGRHSDDENDTSIVRIHPDDLDAYVAACRVRTS